MLAVVLGKEVDLPDPSNRTAVIKYVTNHLLQQNCKSLVEEQCRYRGENNTACAAGCLIPDCDYDPKFEGKVVNHVTHAGDYFRSKGYNITLVGELQTIHDLRPVSDWKKHLEALLNG